MSDHTLGTFAIDEEIERFQPAERGGGRRAEILIKVHGLRVVLVTMRQGIELHEHTAPGPISIQALRGRFTVEVDGEHRPLAAGSLIGIAAGVRHTVIADEDGAFLLTIGGTGAHAPVE